MGSFLKGIMMKKQFICLYINVAILLLLATGCTAIDSGSAIKPGEKVTVSYTCKAKDHGVIDTSVASVAENEQIKKARVFEKKKTYSSPALVAQTSLSPLKEKLIPLTHEILKQLSTALVGKQKNKHHVVKIESQVIENLKKGSRYQVIRRNKTVLRYQEYTLDSFVRGYKRQPKVGEIFYEKGIPHSKVTAVGNGKVTIKMFNDDLNVPTPWGTAHVVGGNEKQVHVRHESKKGNLVRFGHMIGRVILVDDEKIVIDLGHPFGGETLTCDVVATDFESDPTKETALNQANIKDEQVKK